jgi:2-oxoisovalerate dehydrogenase E1 component alpha subunit
MKDFVNAAWKEAVSYGTMNEAPFLDARLMFEDVFKEMPDHLKKQQEEMLALEADPS